MTNDPPDCSFCGAPLDGDAHRINGLLRGEHGFASDWACLRCPKSPQRVTLVESTVERRVRIYHTVARIVSSLMTLGVLYWLSRR
jgi:hypothetical protein